MVVHDSGLQHNVERPHTIIIGSALNTSWSTEDNITYFVPSETWWPWCDYWKSPQNLLMHLAYSCFVLAYLAPCSKRGVLFMHCVLIIGFSLIIPWAWNIICAPDVFVWHLGYLLINTGQVVHILYHLRPVKFDPELEEVFHALFEPFKITRLQFKKMVTSDVAQIMSLHAGEAYAVQNLTSTDRLGLLISGKVNVLSDSQFLHPILPCEFLDSPEFESSRNTADEKFKVSIVAASSCRYLFWQRSSLEYLFVKDPYVATVVTTLIARDVSTKLYAMNNKIITAKGSHLDIRLPSITSSLATGGEYKSPLGVKKGQIRSILSPKVTKHPICCVVDEVASSTEDTLSNDLDNLLDSSSKYHSCELVEGDSTYYKP